MVSINKLASAPNKSLGQHWLADSDILKKIVSYADIKTDDTVLEIGPGLGTLTEQLIATKAHIMAVEFDTKLAGSLAENLYNPNNLVVINQDILKFDFTSLAPNYIVVANIPYYLTSKLIRVLSESHNPPKRIILLIQKEVAERVCAGVGNLSLLGISTQVYYDCRLGIIVEAKHFVPPPKVDSQVIILNRLKIPLVSQQYKSDFFKVVRAGFSEKRKKLRSSLSGGLRISKEESDTLLSKASIDTNLRAQNLSIDQWLVLAKTWQDINK